MQEGEQELKQDEETTLESIDQSLKEILKWTRFANISKLKETLEKELNTDEKKLAFENSDGIRKLDDVAALSGAPRDTVYGWWQKWFRLGLVTESATRQGRMAKIVSLDDVGIKTPKKTKGQTGQEVAQIQRSEGQQTPEQPVTTEAETT